MTDAELAYMAGIIDGEGSICLFKHEGRNSPRHYYRTQISVGSIDKPLIDWINDRWPGRSYVECKPHRMPFHRWYRYGPKCVEVVNAIYPYLIIKRPHADVIIRMQQALRTGRSMWHLTPDEITLRNAIYADFVTVAESRKVQAAA